MDSASSLAYPGSRILAGWWRQLQAYGPTGLWVGHLYVHRVEALAEAVESRPIDPLTLHVLQALAGVPGQRGTQHLAQQLHLPSPAVQQLLRGLAGQQLVNRGEPGHWRVSEHGQAVLQAGADVGLRRERRVFPFVERLNPTGRRTGPPHYLPLAECPAQPWDVDEGHRFDPALLAACAAQPLDWRGRYGFPVGIQNIVTASDSEANGVWERVIVDRPQRLVVAAALTSGGELLAFAAEANGWQLRSGEPVLRLGAGACELIADGALTQAAWEEAWRLWCRQRHLPRSEAEACLLHFDGPHLDVQAPDAFVQRLHAAKSDLLRDEAGLLAGDGYVRGLALLRLRTAG